MRSVTAEQFSTYPHHERYDLIRGVLRICEPPGGVHGRLAVRIAARLENHVAQHQLGTVLVETGYVLRKTPDTVRGPDISFVGTARLPPDQIPVQFISGAPDLAIEILSSTSRRPEIEELLADYFAAGTRMVWVVDAPEQRVTVHYPDRPARVLAGNDILEGEDVVPGFCLTIAELFARG